MEVSRRLPRSAPVEQRSTSHCVACAEFIVSWIIIVIVVVLSSEKAREIRLEDSSVRTQEHNKEGKKGKQSRSKRTRYRRRRRYRAKGRGNTEKEGSEQSWIEEKWERETKEEKVKKEKKEKVEDFEEEGNEEDAVSKKEEDVEKEAEEKRKQKKRGSRRGCVLISVFTTGCNWMFAVLRRLKLEVEMCPPLEISVHSDKKKGLIEDFF